MPIYKKENQSLFFIHIPRNAGRYFTWLVGKNNFDCSDNDYQRKINGVEYPHIHYDIYKNLNYDYLKHFAIIRDPINRFKSVLKKYAIYKNQNLNSIGEILHNIKSYDDFLFIIKDYPSNDFFPQDKFISKKTNLWKLENGFKQSFFKWFNEKINIDLIDKKVNYDKGDYDKLVNIDLNNNILNYIKKYYLKDFKIHEKI